MSNGFPNHTPPTILQLLWAVPGLMLVLLATTHVLFHNDLFVIQRILNIDQAEVSIYSFNSILREAYFTLLGIGLTVYFLLRCFFRQVEGFWGDMTMLLIAFGFSAFVFLFGSLMWELRTGLIVGLGIGLILEIVLLIWISL